MRTQNLGLLGEKIASQYLLLQGYKILDRNFRSRFGEIDIVAQEKDVLVFVEVKTRWSDNYGLPEEAITAGKIKKIIKAGQYYKLLHPELSASLRLDAVAVELDSDGAVKDIRLIKNLTS
jgi:putative endonuclease